MSNSQPTKSDLTYIPPNARTTITISTTTHNSTTETTTTHTIPQAPYLRSLSIVTAEIGSFLPSSTPTSTTSDDATLEAANTLLAMSQGSRQTAPLLPAPAVGPGRINRHLLSRVPPPAAVSQVPTTPFGPAANTQPQNQTLPQAPIQNQAENQRLQALIAERKRASNERGRRGHKIGRTKGLIPEP